MMFTAIATASSVDWGTLITAASFNGLIDGITDALPVVIPVALTLAGIPIVWKYVKKFIR